MYHDVTKHQFMIEKELLEFIQYLLLNQKIRLSEVPPSFRILSKSIYMNAFRVDRNVSREQYLEDLNLLKEDIANAEECNRPYMKRLYQDMKDGIKYINVPSE